MWTVPSVALLSQETVLWGWKTSTLHYSAPAPSCSAACVDGAFLGWFLWESLSSRKRAPCQEEHAPGRVIRALVTCCCCQGFGWYLSAVLEEMQSSFFWSGRLCWAMTNHFSVFSRAIGWSNGAELQGWQLFLPGESNRFTICTNA